MRNGSAAMTFDEAPDLLTVAEVQELTRWSRNGIYEAIKQGRLPAARLGRAVRVPKWELRRFIESGLLDDGDGRPA